MHRHPFLTRLCERESLLETPHQLLPLRRAPAARRGLIDRVKIPWRIHHHHQPVAASEELELLHSLGGERGDHLRPDRVERRDSGDLAWAAQLDEQGGDASGVVLGVAALGR